MISELWKLYSKNNQLKQLTIFKTSLGPLRQFMHIPVWIGNTFIVFWCSNFMPRVPVLRSFLWIIFCFRFCTTYCYVDYSRLRYFSYVVVSSFCVHCFWMNLGKTVVRVVVGRLDLWVLFFSCTLVFSFTKYVFHLRYNSISDDALTIDFSLLTLISSVFSTKSISLSFQRF